MPKRSVNYCVYHGVVISTCHSLSGSKETQLACCPGLARVLCKTEELKTKKYTGRLLLWRMRPLCSVGFLAAPFKALSSSTARLTESSLAKAWETLVSIRAGGPRNLMKIMRSKQGGKFRARPVKPFGRGRPWLRRMRAVMEIQLRGRARIEV